MSDKPLPSFKSIAAPLDVDDAALDRVNAKLGVPTLTRSEAPPPEKSQLLLYKPEKEVAIADAARTAPPTRAASEKLTIEIPGYLGDAIRQAAVTDRKTARHVVMVALKRAGFRVDDADLIPDGRRNRGKP